MAKRRLIAGTINRYPAEQGWENVHLDKSPQRPVDIVADLADLSVIADGEFDEIRCWQVFEHLPLRDTQKAMGEFYRVLRPGGALDIEVPDLERIIEAWVKGQYPRPDLARMIYGDDFPMPDDHLNAHRSGWWPESLSALIREVGFPPPTRIDDGSLQLRFRVEKCA